MALNNYYTAPPNSDEFDTATAVIITWNRIEIYAWFGIIVSNIVFMFSRSVLKPALDPTVYIDETKKLP
jgi:hypothetical protein